MKLSYFLNENLFIELVIEISIWIDLMLHQYLLLSPPFKPLISNLTSQILTSSQSPSHLILSAKTEKYKQKRDIFTNSQQNPSPSPHLSPSPSVTSIRHPRNFPPLSSRHLTTSSSIFGLKHHRLPKYFALLSIFLMATPTSPSDPHYASSPWWSTSLSASSPSIQHHRPSTPPRQAPPSAPPSSAVHVLFPEVSS